MNTTSLLEAVKKDARQGLLLVAEQLGSALAGDASFKELAKGLTGHVPKDERTRGIRDALLEVLSAAEAARLNAVRQRPPAIVAKTSWKEVLLYLADGSVHQLTSIATSLGGDRKKGTVSTALDELEDEGLVERAVGPGMAKNARYVRLTEAGLSFAATLAQTKPVTAVQRSAPAPVAAHGVNWFDASKAFELVELANLGGACRVAQSSTTLVFDLGRHPDRSWKALPAHTFATLAQVLADATLDPVPFAILRTALAVACPEAEPMKFIKTQGAATNRASLPASQRVQKTRVNVKDE
jgi:DNA-binding MarR family transcriptional regulator